MTTVKLLFIATACRRAVVCGFDDDIDVIFTFKMWKTIDIHGTISFYITHGDSSKNDTSFINVFSQTEKKSICLHNSHGIM